ncbi:hypothetical protein Tco_1402234 [Tanacetum coccineum]
MQKGFSATYDKWTRHGESSDDDEYVSSDDEEGFMKFEDHSETSPSHGGTRVTPVGAVPLPQLPKLQESVYKSMFFC